MVGQETREEELVKDKTMLMILGGGCSRYIIIIADQKRPHHTTANDTNIRHKTQVNEALLEAHRKVVETRLQLEVHLKTNVIPFSGKYHRQDSSSWYMHS